MSGQEPQAQAPDDEAYNQIASSHSKSAIFIWCIVGYAYAFFTWRLLWLPAILIFVPGVFVASIIASFFFIPLWFVMKKVNRDWELEGKKNVGLMIVATTLKIGGFAASVAAPIGYIKLLQHFLN